MNSLRNRILLLSLIAIFFTVVCISVGSIANYVRQGTSAARQEMTMLCHNQRDKLNGLLWNIEKSVNIGAQLAEDAMKETELAQAGKEDLDGKDVTEYSTDINDQWKRYLDSYVTGVADTIFIAAENTEGILDVCYEINPQLSGQAAGFLLLKDASGGFLPGPVPDLLEDEGKEAGYTGWYYQPLKQNELTWLGPYDSDHLGTEVISCVSPVWKDNTFLGVMRMDIEYDTLISLLDEIRVFDTGYAFLTDQDGVIVSHEDIEKGTHISEYDQDLAKVIRDLSEAPDEVMLTESRYQGTDKLITAAKLRNGLVLVLSVPEEETAVTWKPLVRNIAVIAAAMLLIFGGLIALVMTQITKPLKDLSAAAERLQQGDYDVELDYRGKDEIGVLTTSFQHLVRHLKTYISDLNSRAYQDAMTGVKNKRAYEIFCHQMEDMVQAYNREGGILEFAVVMFDCNNLKLINDTYGHGRGDEYLKDSCKLICDIFASSPVFRVGGDEFAAVLHDIDYMNRDGLVETFDRELKARAEKAGEPWKRISIARGMAVFDPAADMDVRSVILRADDAMYEDKREKKGEKREETH